MTPEQQAAIATAFTKVMYALEEVIGKVGKVSARATRMETRQARMLEHLGLTHEGRPTVVATEVRKDTPAPVRNYHAFPDSSVTPG